MVAEAAGFQKYETTNNKLDPSGDLVIDAMLTVGSASQTVEVRHQRSCCRRISSGAKGRHSGAD